jgi:hypothetical protein
MFQEGGSTKKGFEFRATSTAIEKSKAAKGAKMG